MKHKYTRPILVILFILVIIFRKRVKGFIGRTTGIELFSQDQTTISPKTKTTTLPSTSFSASEKRSIIQEAHDDKRYNHIEEVLRPTGKDGPFVRLLISLDKISKQERSLSIEKQEAAKATQYLEDIFKGDGKFASDANLKKVLANIKLSGKKTGKDLFSQGRNNNIPSSKQREAMMLAGFKAQELFMNGILSKSRRN